jgi:hypothetical protein
MNDERPPSNFSGPKRHRVPKMIWLLVALAPSIPIMLANGANMAHGAGAGTLKFVGLGLNPALTIVGCYGLLHKPGQSKLITIVTAIVLGAFFALFNIFLGALGGCAFSHRP